MCVWQSNINPILGEHLGVNGSDQGAQEDVVLADMGKIAPEESQVWQDSRQDWYRVLGEIKTRDAVEWLVEEDLRGQHVLAALAHDMGTKAAKETFRQVFLKRETPHPVRDQEPMLGMVGVAEGIITIVVGKDASVALSRGNKASLSKQQLAGLLAPSGEPTVEKMLSPIEGDWEMNIGLGLTGAEARRVQAFIRSYRACFAFKLTELEGYKGKPVKIQLEDDYPVFSTSLQVECLGERRG